MDINTTVSNLYNQLILRDFLGYMAPGVIVCAAAGVRILGVTSLFNLVKEMPTVSWVPLLAVFYLVGLAISGLAFEVQPGKKIFAYHNLSSDADFMKRLAEFKCALSNADQKTADAWNQQRERFTSLKQGAASGAVALVIALIILVIPSWHPEAMPWKQYLLRILIVIVIIPLAAYALHQVHVHNRDRQDLFEKEVISRTKTQCDKKSPTNGEGEVVQPK